MKNTLLLLSSVIFSTYCFGQVGFPPPYASNPSQAITNANFAWYRGGNFPGGQAGVNNIFGTRWASDIWIMTNNTLTARFTYNSPLTSWLGNAGDGLSILAPPNTSGNLDLFTSSNAGASETHAKFGASGQVSGQNNRFEFISVGAAQGNYYSTFSGAGIHRFDRGQTEYGRLGTNNFWRFGENTSGPFGGGLSAGRRVEVVDNNIQFRLTYSANSAGPYTDFLSNSSGNLQILPLGGRVGINLQINPTANLDVNGNARIRDVQVSPTPDALFVGEVAGGAEDLNVRRLDFTGNANDVLLGNGQWGNPPSNITADNGVSRAGNVVRLGDVYNPLFPPFNTFTPLTTNRQIRLGGNNLVFSGAGNVGVGLSFPVQPTERIDVSGNARFRNIPAQGGQSLILGTQLSANQNDVVLSRLLFPNDNTQVLLGDGTWGPAVGVGFTTCSAPSGTGLLLDDSKIPLNDFNFYFDGQGVSGNRVGVGYNCTNLLAKFNVYTNEGTGIGIFSQVERLGGLNIGGQFRVSGGDDNSGVSAFASGGNLVMGGEFGSIGGTILSYGVVGKGSSSLTTTLTIGVRGEATGANPFGTNIGVYGEATGPGTNWAGYFAGPVMMNGVSLPSDANFKENIEVIDNAVFIINSLNPVNFDFLQTGNAEQMHFASGEQEGFIAQELELILPNLVSDVTHPAKYDSLGNVISNEFNYKAVNYTKIIPYLVADAQNKNAKIDSLLELTSFQDSINTNLNDRLTLLEECLSNILPALCQANQMAIESTPDEIQNKMNSIIDVELRNGNNIVLNQNVPNPFAERTVITFSIPESVAKAQIHFYDGKGKLINSVDVNERGNGQINVYAADLSSGMYTYSLVADGKIVATKRMMKN